MAAPKGHPNYNIDGIGRPEVFDQNFADQLAEDFLEWWHNNPQSFWFYEYFTEVRRMSKQKVNRLKEKSEKLVEALEQAFESQETRIYKAGMNKAASEGMSKFGLACKHRWTPEKQEIKITADDNAKTILDKVSGKSANLVTND